MADATLQKDRQSYKRTDSLTKDTAVPGHGSDRG